MSAAIYYVFCGSQCQKSHRSPCMKLLGADSDFSTVAKLKSICKSCRRIHIHCCGIYFIQKHLCIIIITCNNGLRMFCIILINMCNCFFYRVYNLYRQNIVKIFCSPICFNGWNCPLYKIKSFFILLHLVF